MQRKQPLHILKIYEALGCIGDSRLELIPSEDGIISVQVTSFDRSKVYHVSYQQLSQSLIYDDKSFDGDATIGYPGLALLLFLDILDYQSEYGEALSSIGAKFIKRENQDNENLVQKQIDDKLKLQGIDIDALHDYCDMLLKKLQGLSLHLVQEK